MTLDTNQIRAKFGALNQAEHGQTILFLDGPGGTQIPDSVAHSMTDYWQRGNSNLGGAFETSRHTTEVMLEARTYCQALVNAPAAENIVFGANMTSLTFQLSRAISREWQAGDEVIVTALDHYANVSTWQQAANDRGAVVKTANLCRDNATLDVEHLLRLITAKTRLVAVTCASNVTGSIVDVKPIIDAAHAVGAKVYLDAVHYAPHHLIDVQAWQCDFLVCSAYKFFGPHIGIAYIAQPWLEQLQPYKVAPAPDIGPGRFETGTQPFASLAGLSTAVGYLASFGHSKVGLRSQLLRSYSLIQQHEMALNELFLQRLKAVKGVELLGIDDADIGQRTPTFALRFERHRPYDIAHALGMEQVCVWSGHFYALGMMEQLKIDPNLGVLRVGAVHYNTKDEIERFFRSLTQIIQ
ncbi:cysteine desulfurase-like protein [Vibrio sp. CAIM 722]|uniref:Cysteine desulfurase-like protein n=1 Tax=Vibrio eleionomae TaxID=2653505 RepID=A0A7X4RUW0_9VIBR|nr:cysteine desulfurase-like protein [Vibrio eleionomae]MZI93682.1 cysteine desulfurase-like protein [Vibrio eleionomae]